jgi:SAM-dependent methyltransferase
MVDRSAESFAAFFLPHLQPGDRVLDCGCGSGSISIGLGGVVGDGQVVAFDVDSSLFAPAIRYMEGRSIDHVRFLGADGNALPFNDATFDAALCHSMLETLPDPKEALDEIMRVLVPGGVFGAASVDYGGLILAGPKSDVLERFYAMREQLWDIESIARPRSGRDLRGLLHATCFTDIEAGARYVSHGDAAAIRSFGEARASECVGSSFSSRAVELGLITESELNGIERAWRSWSTSPDAFLAFPWLHATARKPVSDSG